MFRNCEFHFFHPLAINDPRQGEPACLTKNQILLSITASFAVGIITTLVAQTFLAVACRHYRVFYGHFRCEKNHLSGSADRPKQ